MVDLICILAPGIITVWALPFVYYLFSLSPENAHPQSLLHSGLMGIYSKGQRVPVSCLLGSKFCPMPIRSLEEVEMASSFISICVRKCSGRRKSPDLFCLEGKILWIYSILGGNMFRARRELRDGLLSFNRKGNWVPGRLKWVVKADLGQALVCPDLFLQLFLASLRYTVFASGKHPHVVLAMKITLHLGAPSISVRAGDCLVHHLILELARIFTGVSGQREEYSESSDTLCFLVEGSQRIYGLWCRWLWHWHWWALRVLGWDTLYFWVSSLRDIDRCTSCLLPGSTLVFYIKGPPLSYDLLWPWGEFHPLGFIFHVLREALLYIYACQTNWAIVIEHFVGPLPAGRVGPKTSFLCSWLWTQHLAPT